jgi:hypothetical protein
MERPVNTQETPAHDTPWWQQATRSGPAVEEPSRVASLAAHETELWLVGGVLLGIVLLMGNGFARVLRAQSVWLLEAPASPEAEGDRHPTRGSETVAR